MKITTRFIVKTAAVAAIYTALTVALSFISYGNIQFRVSEMMTLLAFLDPAYIPGLTIGCLISNLLGPNGFLDIVVGTLATFISVAAIAVTGKFLLRSKVGIWIASLWPTVFNGLIIGYLLHILYKLPLLLTMAEVALGEFVVITVVGVPVFFVLPSKYRQFLSALFKK